MHRNTSFEMGCETETQPHCPWSYCKLNELMYITNYWLIPQYEPKTTKASNTHAYNAYKEQ